MLLLYHYRFAGGGALRDLAAAQCSTPPPQLGPCGDGDANAPVAADVFRGAADPLTNAFAIPQYRGDSGWWLARDTHGGRQNDRVGNLLGTRSTMWRRVRLAVSVLYFRSHSIPAIFLRHQCDQFPRVFPGPLNIIIAY